MYMFIEINSIGFYIKKELFLLLIVQILRDKRNLILSELFIFLNYLIREFF